MATESIFQKQVSPLLQGGVILGITLAIMLIGNGLSDDSMFPWTISATFLLCYVLFNSALSFAYEKQGMYWILSLAAYFVIVIIGALVASWLSGLALGEAKSMKMIYIIFTVGYVVLLSIVRSMRGILQIVLKQDKRLRGEE